MPTKDHNLPFSEGGQIDKFRDLVRKLECDEDEKAFEEKVRKVANANPSKSDGPQKD